MQEPPGGGRRHGAPVLRQRPEHVREERPPEVVAQLRPEGVAPQLAEQPSQRRREGTARGGE